MPEQISKYPDVTLQVLKSAGAVCGEGAEQKILSQCPMERFCSLPTGEICVYGIEEIPQMTQITTMELARVVSPGAMQSPKLSTNLPSTEWILFGIVFAVGLILGRLSRGFLGRRHTT